MANYEATKYDFDGANLTGIEGIPTATIVPWSSASVPSGFLECDGSAVSRTTYATLFGIVGTTYGVGDGATTFNVPDLADNVPVGKSNNKSLASTGGANTVATAGNVGGSTANATLSEAQLASHYHPMNAKTPNPHGFTNPFNYDVNTIIGNPGSFSPPAPYQVPSPGRTSSVGSSSGHSHNMSATFSGDSTSVLQPYLALIYIIKT